MDHVGTYFPSLCVSKVSMGWFLRQIVNLSPERSLPPFSSHFQSEFLVSVSTDFKMKH